MARSFGGPKGKQSPPVIRRALFALAVAGPPGVLPDAERWRRMKARAARLPHLRHVLEPRAERTWWGLFHLRPAVLSRRLFCSGHLQTGRFLSLTPT